MDVKGEVDMRDMIDLRSDTVTKPTAAMREAMSRAEVGDDVYGEDPTVRRLEETAAALLGKEAGLFVTSGTQGNQAAILAHTGRGDEVIVEAEAHIFYYEAGAMAALAGVQPRLVAGKRGQMPLEDIAAAIREPNIHFPTTRVICLENTHNRAGGAALPLEYSQSVYRLAKNKGVAVHLDGARLFNAVAASRTSAREFAAAADSVQICLSKGLGAPVGSVLTGTKDFIARARKWRKALGGGMRQAGVIAAPGLIALTEMVDRLQEDHDRAKRLATGLANINGLAIRPEEVETNIVVARLVRTSSTEEEFLQALAEHGVLATAFGAGAMRFVTHYGISDTDVEAVLTAVHATLLELQLARR